MPIKTFNYILTKTQPYRKRFEVVRGTLLWFKVRQDYKVLLDTLTV